VNLPVEVIEAVRQRRCLLVLGSRATLEAAELQDHPWPDNHSLATSLGWKKPRPVPGSRPKPQAPSVEEAAGELENRLGRAALIAQLQAALATPFGPSAAHRSLWAHFPLILSTSYDSLLVQAAPPSVRQLFRDDDFPTASDPAQPTVIHLRGQLSRPETVLVTRRDFEQHPLATEQRRALRTLIRAHVVLFVGFRPDEEEFERCFSEFSDAYGGELPRCHLAVGQGPIDDFLWQKWVWRGLLMFMADPTEAMAELEAQLP
jgi:hypothetical protein